jgi:hypothetical protein
MNTAAWQIGFPSGNSATTYRGIRIVITRSATGDPIEIGWFIGGRVAESVPVSCDLEWAKKMRVDVIDERISIDEVWQEAEKKDRESDLAGD